MADNGNNNLRSIQKNLMDWLTGCSDDIRSQVSGTDKVGVDTRLGIYGNAYTMRLIEALMDAYPAVHTLLGDDGFMEMAKEYVRHNPSQHYSIRWFGHRLSRFLDQQPPWSETPVLGEMAAFEWRLRDAFDAPDVNPLTLADIQRVPPEQWAKMRLGFTPTLQRLELNWNITELWQAIDEEQEPFPPEKFEYPVSWAIWRKNDLKTYYRSLDVDEAWSLDAAVEGATFGEICGGLVEWIDEQHTPQRAASFIARWIEDELITSLK